MLPSSHDSWAVSARCLALAFLVPLLPAASSAAEPPSDDWRLQPLEWSASARGLESVEIVNEHGQLHARAAAPLDLDAPDDDDSQSDETSPPEAPGQIPPDHVAVYATAQQPTAETAVARVDATRDGSRLVVRIVLPDGPRPEDVPDELWRKRRVDATVYVPKNLPTTVRTLHDKARVKKTSGPVTVRSVSGEIEVIASGPVDASTDHGAMRVSLLDDAWQGTTLQTTTGSLEVHVPWEISPCIVAESRGGIALDQSTELEWLSDSLRKRVTTAGAAECLRGPHLEIRSARGDVRVERRPPLRGQ